MSALGWQNAAACRGESIELFFGCDGERPAERDIRVPKAKAICAVCPVRSDCLSYAAVRPEKHGIWGGMTEDERESARRNERRRALTRAAARAAEAEEQVA